MKLVCLSDTHEQGRKINVPYGDVLIHCGDLTYLGKSLAVVNELEWLVSLPHRWKLFIAGNHDFLFEREPYEVKAILNHYKGDLIYLEETGMEIDGVKFWGSPYQPEFLGWAFNRKRGKELASYWAKIPDHVDVLITHAPPFGFGDTNGDIYDKRFGDQDLLDRVLKVRPKYHVYGHAHGGYGQYEFNGIKFINCSSCNEQYEPVNPPVVIDYDVSIG